MRKLLVLLVILILFLGLWSAAATYAPHFSDMFKIPGLHLGTSITTSQPVKVVTEESVTVDAVKNVGPSVVTVVEQASTAAPDQQSQSFNFGPFTIFGLPQQGGQPTDPNQPQAIGSGFIVSGDGMIVTNKHVVGDTAGTYQVITADNKKYDVQKVYRDPLNDIAILKIDPSQNLGSALKPVTLGNSDNLQVGQFVIAIGTALGEFRNTVTTGVVSGLGRGITAGDQFQGSSEQLNNVIQTSAAINPGNSGGPLLNSSGQVIGINTAVAQSGQNIGFALPVNVVKDSLNNFNQTGQFNRPYLGVAYKFITKDLAIVNNLPQGAYIEQVVAGSPADKAGIHEGDVVTKFDGTTISDVSSNSLATLIAHKKVGDNISMTLWRDGKTIEVTATLTSAPQQ